MYKLPKFNSGQTLLIVLLSMAVVLTIVLSIIARSVTDVSITSQEQDSYRAFSAAEAGIEQALAGVTLLANQDIGGATFNAHVDEYGIGQKEVVYPIPLISGDSATFWFVSHDADGKLVCGSNPCFAGDPFKICWGKIGTDANSDKTPAIELSVFYTSDPGNYSTTKIARAAIDPNTLRQGASSFSAPDAGTCTIAGEAFQFKKTFHLADLKIPPTAATVKNILQFATVKLFYNTDLTHKIGLSASSSFPSQGIEIASSGNFAQANRNVNVFQSYAEIPSIFQGAIYSLGGLVKP